MSKGEDCRALIAKAAERFGGVDILVNNAGIQHVAAIEEFPVETWDRVIAINMNSAFHTTAAALPMMREHKWGRVVNIASAHGLTASPYKSAYVTAKHGVVGMTKVVALETAEDPITCNAICPGYVLTPLVEAQIPDTMEKYGMDRETVVREVLAGTPAVETVRDGRADRRDGCLPVLRSRRADHRHDDLRRWRLDRALAVRLFPRTARRRRRSPCGARLPRWVRRADISPSCLPLPA
jgi:NAD(P)-dependent dehydrogenase (short-subunit alcohol dehydrogenase family)